MSTARVHEADPRETSVDVTVRHGIAKRVGMLILPVLVVAASVASWQTGVLDSEPSATADAKSLPVATRALARQSAFAYTRQYTGEIVANRQSEVGFEIPGQVARLLVDDGDAVVAGQVLVQLDARRIEALGAEVAARLAGARAQLEELVAGARRQTIEAARARVDELAADHELLRRKRVRRTELVERGAASAEELDDAVSLERAAAARLEQARHDLDALEEGTRRERIAAQRAQVAQLEAQAETIAIDLEKSVLRAPFDATVVQRLVDEGEVVAAGQRVFRLIERGVLQAYVGVPLEALEQLEPETRVRLSAGTDAVRAIVRSRIPEVDPTTRTVTVVLDVSPEDVSRVFAGQMVRLSVTQDKRQPGFWIPTTALVRAEKGLWSCYVVSPDGVLERRPVEVVHTEARRAFVQGLVNEGETIVTAGVHRLSPGQRVSAEPTQ